jgi:chemotaxis protein MotA
MATPQIKKKASARPDLGSIGGLLLGLGAILGGLTLDGGRVYEIIQVNAAVTVLGGTIGALMLATPLPVLLGAVKKLGCIFFEAASPVAETIETIIGYATRARREGIVALEDEAAGIADPFLRKALNLAVDGKELSQIRSIMELEIDLIEQRGEAEAKAFEAAGGFAPTIGIIGAVLGLMQVLKSLANIDRVGEGIAAAFVATVYGVGSANLFFLPAGGKLRARLQSETQLRELMLEGVLAIVEGLNPKLIRTRLDAYLAAPASGPKAAAGRKAAAQVAASGD